MASMMSWMSLARSMLMPKVMSSSVWVRHYSRVDKNAGILFKVTTSAAVVDPAIVRRREEKRLRKIERVLRRVDRPDERVRIPIKELAEDPRLADPKAREERRKPPVHISAEEEERRVAVQKEWSRFASKRYLHEIKAIDRVILAQRRALEQLKKCNEKLYMAAISFDEALLPMKMTGPVRTPPIPDHIQDGEWIDVTKKHEVQYEDIEAHWKRLSVKKRVRKKKSDDSKDDD